MNKNIATKNRYLLIDYGNSRIKAAIYNKQTNKIEEYLIIDNHKSLSDLLSMSSKIANVTITKIIMSATPSGQKTKPFELELINKFNIPVNRIVRKDFDGLINFDNIASDVVIGNDILLQAYWAIKNYKSAAIFCLGTVYVGFVVKDKQFKSVYLLPSVAKGLKDIARVSNIPDSLIPKQFNKTIGLNTNDSFASGANESIYGWVNSIVKQFNVNNVIITGGDNHLYSLLTKNYDIVDDLVLKALALLVKEKCW